MFAVKPSQPNQQRYVSFMWPGFIGTLSGFNESGIHFMEDSGNGNRGPTVTNMTTMSWIYKVLLEDFTKETLTPESAEDHFLKYKTTGNGSSGAGGIHVIGKPCGHGVPTFIYEADRFGGVMRLPTDTSIHQYICASNHFLKYKTDNPPTLNSQWRYEAGMNLCESWMRVKRPIGIEEMKRCLQTAAHNTTEHSVIVLPSKLTFFGGTCNFSR